MGRLKGITDLYAVEDARKEAQKQPPVETTPVISTPVESTPAVNMTSPPLEKLPAVETTPPVETTPAAIKKGYQRIPNEVMDNILPTMRPAEQAVYLRLYRLSHGFNQRTCLISLPALALKCHLSESQTRFAVRNVEARGYIRQVRVEQGAAKRGIEFEVWTPMETTPVKSAGVETTGMETTPNIIKNIKDITNRDILCPDCKNTGWYYPEGVAKGVKKCPHEKLNSRPPE